MFSLLSNIHHLPVVYHVLPLVQYSPPSCPIPCSPLSNIHHLSVLYRVLPLVLYSVHSLVYPYLMYFIFCYHPVLNSVLLLSSIQLLSNPVFCCGPT
jgi:hypothetical protein